MAQFKCHERHVCLNNFISDCTALVVVVTSIHLSMVVMFFAVGFSHFSSFIPLFQFYDVLKLMALYTEERLARNLALVKVFSQ